MNIMIEWLKKNWYVPVFVLVVWLISLKPRGFRGKKQKSHHGINKYGETY